MKGSEVKQGNRKEKHFWSFEGFFRKKWLITIKREKQLLDSPAYLIYAFVVT